jgi:hypothetical protein
MSPLRFLHHGPAYLETHGTFHCEPVTITALALAAASTTASLVGQRQQAKATASYQQDLAKANVSAAQVQAEQVRDQQAQANEATQREAQKAAQASRAAQATATTAAGEAGVAGNSVEALLRDFRAQEGAYKEALLRQRQLSDVSSGQQVEAIQANAAAGNLAMNAPVAQPNYLAGALSFGAQAASVYATEKRNTPQTHTKA